MPCTISRFDELDEKLSTLINSSLSSVISQSSDSNCFLDLYTSLLKLKKLSLSPSFVESKSVRGNSCEQMTFKLENKAF